MVRYDGKLSPGLKALGELPLAAWVQILGAIAVVELTVGKQDYENKVHLVCEMLLLLVCCYPVAHLFSACPSCGET